jgi:hypothetical protein
VANDATGSITMVESQIALPEETTARARALLTQLIAEYSYSNSTHPLESGPAVDDVFLLDLPLAPAATPETKQAEAKKAAEQKAAEQAKLVVKGWSAPDGPPSNIGSESTAPTTTVPAGGKLAIVNLHGSFADNHPSGIEAETLTIDSIIGTIYANFPSIVQVRFLVDGQSRETLNGHADLLRTYEVVDTSSRAIQEIH